MLAMTTERDRARSGPVPGADRAASTGLRVVLAEDDLLLREGLASFCSARATGWSVSAAAPGSGRCWR